MKRILNESVEVGNAFALHIVKECEPEMCNICYGSVIEDMGPDGKYALPAYRRGRGGNITVSLIKD